MFTGNIYYRGDKTAAEDVLHEATQLANSSVAKKDYLGVANFREQFVLSSGATLDIVLGEHTTFMTIVGFGAEFEEEVVEEFEEEEKYERLYVCSPLSKYHQVIVSEVTSGGVRKVKLEWGDGIKGGPVYAQYREDNDDLISINCTVGNKFIDGASFSEIAGQDVYMGGYTLVHTDKPCVGAAKVTADVPGQLNKHTSYCFVTVDVDTEEVLFYQAALVAVDYTSEDFSTPLVDFDDDCTLIDTIDFKVYDYANITRTNDETTLCTFNKDGDQAVISALNGQYLLSPNNPSAAYSTEETKQDFWELEFSYDSDKNLVVTPTYEGNTVVRVYEEEVPESRPSYVPGPPGASPIYTASPCAGGIYNNCYSYVDDWSYFKAAYVQKTNGVPDVPTIMAKAMNPDGTTEKAEHMLHQYCELDGHPIDMGGYLGPSRETECEWGVSNPYGQDSGDLAPLVATLGTNPPLIGFRTGHTHYVGFGRRTSGFGGTGDGVYGAIKETISFNWATYETDKKLTIDMDVSGYYLSRTTQNYESYSSAEVAPDDPDTPPVGCPWKITVDTTPAPDQLYAIGASAVENIIGWDIKPIQFSLREGVSLTLNYKKPHQSQPVVRDKKSESGNTCPYDQPFFTYQAYLSVPAEKDYSLHGDAYYTLNCCGANGVGVSIDLPGIASYHGNLPDSVNSNPMRDELAHNGHAFYLEDTVPSLWVGTATANPLRMWNYFGKVTNYAPVYTGCEKMTQPDGVWKKTPVESGHENDPYRAMFAKFCAHPKGYLMYSINDDYLRSKFAANTSDRKIVWYFYNMEHNEFTDLTPLYNELLARTPSLAAVAPLVDNVPESGNTTDFMDVFGMISKIPAPKLRIP